AALYIAFRPDSLEIVNTYFLEPLGIHYTHAEGSILEGFVLHNIRSDTMEAKTLVLEYNLVKMLKGKHTIDSINIDGLRLQLDDFISNDDSIWPFPTFKLRDVTITNLQLISSYPIELDLHGKNGSYDGDTIHFASLNATFKSRYASGALSGVVQNNSLKGFCNLYPNAAELSPYSGRLTTLPQSLRLTIKTLSADQATLSTTIDNLPFHHDPLVHAEGIKLDFNYLYANDYFDLKALYRLNRGDDSIQMNQTLRYSLEGITSTKFVGAITSSHPLPSNTLKGEFTDSSEGIRGKLILDGSMLELSSNDYDRFLWKVKSDHKNLTFLPNLPVLLSDSPFSMNGFGEYRISDESLHGSIRVDHNHGRFSGTFSTQNGHHFLDGNLTLPQNAPLWKNWAHKPPENLILSLDDESNATHVQLNGDSFALNALLKGEHLKGSGNYNGGFFDIDGTLSDTANHIDINVLIPSLFTTISKFQPIELHHGEYYDAEIRSTTHIDFTDNLTIQSDISIPWYAAVLDSQRSFGGTNGSIKIHYREGVISIDRYHFEIADHPIYSDKRSILHLSDNGDVSVEEFWIFDSLRVNGVIRSDMSTNLHLQSNRFTYTGPEGSAHASADLTYQRDTEENQNLFGSITMLDSTITYLPMQQFKVMDDDIIIIQDVRPPSSSRVSMNVHITAQQPVRFKTKELDLRLDPDITLWKDPSSPMQILGMVSIPGGTATTAGKNFEIKHSEIYFGGDIPLNPHLNITIGHEVDYNKILIYVTHTLDSPIFLFSSDPVMSQNDIMSYILFGTPANTISGGDNSTSTVRADATNFMLGAGLKGLIGGITKLQIDTMNILTTAEGGMGFEVGARLNKDLRILYKNDTVSSLLLQYTVNRWLRLDADIHELGQGINAIYIKDFRDFLPHNTKVPKK
ncbi:translocation/assembly module TamB domain-containing protein, partial [Sulfuricurvum sp.]|uniref:translocation/assembly module TamB domain-containing protein n=1 Tax=Sulfuricurvum sp. TaxID=2025608 RepID=UPI0019C12D01